MMSKRENIKALFSNTRNRVIIVFTASVMLIMVLVGGIKFYFNTHKEPGAEVPSSGISGSANRISSIPGSMDQTAQYAQLQETQNKTQAQEAQKEGGSSIPTIIKSHALGEGAGVIGSQSGQSGVGFTQLTVQQAGGDEHSLWLQALKDKNCDKASVTEAVSQGAGLKDLKKMCSCGQLKNAGYDLKDLKTICECSELKDLGYSARAFKEAQFSAASLYQCGLSACELRGAGFTAQDLKDGGFSDDELKGAGYSSADIQTASGLPPGVSVSDVRAAACDPQALLKLKQAGVLPGAVRKISGCSVDQLKAAGYSAAELKKAGYSAAELKKAGFDVAALKAAGFTAEDLMKAAVSPEQLAAVGFAADDIKAAQASLNSPEAQRIARILAKTDCSASSLSAAKAAGASALDIKERLGCDAALLKQAGFTADEVSAAEAALKDPELRRIAQILAKTECNAASLSAAKSAGVSALDIKKRLGCSAALLKEVGFSPEAVRAAEEAVAVTGPEAQRIGQILANTDCSVAGLKAAKAAGASARDIKERLGCTVALLKEAGFSPEDLKSAGFTAAELKKLGFSPAALKAAGFLAKELADAGFTAGELKDAGFSAASLKTAGFSPRDLKNAGFSAADLKKAGLSSADLKKAGFTAAALKAAGLSPKELVDAGYDAAELKNSGYSAADLKEAGLSADDLALAGFNQDELNAAGFTAQQISKALAAIPGAAVAGLSALNNNAAPPVPAGLTSAPVSPTAAAIAANNQQLQSVLNRQNQQVNDQKYQQKVQQKTSSMQSIASGLIGEWKKVDAQVFMAGNEEEKSSELPAAPGSLASAAPAPNPDAPETAPEAAGSSMAIKTGDILFAVMDTAVNSDEPGPVLATIVSGKLKGSKLIGSFNLAPNANQMVVTFNTMSVPGITKTVSINAYAIDPNTARTALSSKVNHHYLMRYGSLFASSFLQGIGNAFQSANTTVTIGGSTGSNDVTVQNGIGRSTLENAVIGLATVGQNWGQQVQPIFNTPTTVELYSGTGIGVLFTQDVSLL